MPLRSSRSRRPVRWLAAAGMTTLFALAWVGGLTLVGEDATRTEPFGFGILFGLSVVVGVTWVTFETVSHEADTRLSLPTTITLTRASLVVVLFGFVLVEPPAAPTSWIPGALFAAAAVLDLVDGAVARATDATSETGARLDVEIDALTVLIGAALAVRYGMAPLVFLAVGVARYAFVAGIRLRRRRGLAVHELGASTVRRGVGAVAMATIWLALLPIPGQAASRALATVVVVPFLFAFLRDWLVVSGRLDGS